MTETLHNPTGHEQRDDKERLDRVLRMPTPLTEVVIARLNGDAVSEHDSAARYDAQLEQSLQLPDGSPANALDCSALLADVVADLSDHPDFDAKAPFFIVDDDRDIAHSASVVASLYQNPKDFINHILELAKTNKTQPITEVSQVDTLGTQVTNLAAAIYGQRYTAYKEYLADPQSQPTVEDEPTIVPPVQPTDVLTDEPIELGITDRQFEENRIKDREILYRTPGLWTRAKGFVRKRLNGLERARATAHNAIASPAMVLANRAHKKAQAKHDKKAAKWGLTQPANPLQPESILTRQRREKLATLQSTANEKLTHKSYVEDKRQNRVDTARNSGNLRNEVQQNSINNLKEKKQAATANKALRTALRSREFGKANIGERAAVIERIPKETMQVVGAEVRKYEYAAIQERAATSQLESAHKSLRKAERQLRANQDEHMNRVRSAKQMHEHANNLELNELATLDTDISAAQADLANEPPDTQEYIMKAGHVEQIRLDRLKLAHEIENLRLAAKNDETIADTLLKKQPEIQETITERGKAIIDLEEKREQALAIKAQRERRKNQAIREALINKQP